MTLEDETDIANIIVWPKVFAKNRRTVMTARFLAVRGRLQRAGLVIHVVAQDFVDLSAELPSLRDGELFPPTSCVPDASGRIVAHSQEPRLSLTAPETGTEPAMCGRAKLPDDVSEIKLDLKIDFDEIGDYRPRWNAAPTSKLPVVVSTNGQRTLTAMRWGLIPSWAHRNQVPQDRPFDLQRPRRKRGQPSRLPRRPGGPAAAAWSSPTAITSGATPTNNPSLWRLAIAGR